MQSLPLVGAALVLMAAGAVGLLPFPFLWLLLGAAVGGFAIMRRARSEASRALWFNLGFVLLLLAAGELWYAVLEIRHDRHQARYRGESLYETDPDPLLGYRLRTSSVREAARFFDETEIYRVTYTTGPDGWRIAGPPDAARKDQRSIVFFGGSFTYGEGLDDHETLPWLTAVQLDNRYRAHNLGVHGYGPQHMLAQIEGGILEELEGGPPAHAVYSSIRDHVVRATGERDYLRTSPLYVLQPDHSLVRSAGELDAASRGLSTWLGRWRMLRNLRAQPWAMPAETIATYVAIVERSSALLRERYPDCSFHVVFWDSPGSSLSEAMIEGLRAAGLRVHPVTEILEGYPGNSAYALSPHDGHPSATANYRIAAYIAGQIRAGAEASPLATVSTRAEPGARDR